MNRSFSQKQEIDCSCFDFGIRNHSYSQYKLVQTKPLATLYPTKNSTIKSKNISYNQKTSFKKSLKSKHLNQSTKLETHKKNTLSKQHTRYQSINCSQFRQNKQNQIAKQFQNDIRKNQIIQCKKRPKISIQLQTIQGFRSKNKNSLKQDLMQIKVFAPKQQNKNPKQQKKTSIHQKNRSFIKKNDIAEIDCQQKTIKKKYPNLDQLQKQQKLFPNDKMDQQFKKFKRISIRAQDNINNFANRLNNIYLKQIESFDEQSLSVVESEVIEKGRNTWAPDTFRVEAQQFISSLHLSNRNSKVNTINKPSISSKIASRSAI